MKRVILTLLCLIIINIVFANDLYFVSGIQLKQPNEVHVMKYSGNGVFEKDWKLSEFDQYFVHAITDFQNLGCLIIAFAPSHTRMFKDNLYDHGIIKIDFNEPEKFERRFFDALRIKRQDGQKSSVRSLLDTYLIDHPDYGYSYVFSFFGSRNLSDEEPLYKTKLFDIENGKDIILDNFDPRFYRFCPRYENVIGSNDFQYFTVTDNNRLYNSTRSGDIDKGNLEDYEDLYIPPDSVFVFGDGDHYMYINNTKISVLSDKVRSDYIKGELGESTWIFHDKIMETWYNYTLPGARTTVRAMKNQWVAGSIMGGFYREIRTDYTPEEVNESMNNRGRTGPGRNSVNGDKRIYLFNVGTKQYLELPTRYYDSEVLYMDGNDMYYRDNDEIYHGVLSEEGFSEPELLIKHEYVWNIHWMYQKEGSEK